MSRVIFSLLLLTLVVPHVKAQAPGLGRTYSGALDKIIVQTVTICEAGRGVQQTVEVRPGTTVTRSRACSGHSVEISITDAGFPTILPIGTLEQNATAGPHLRYGTPIETRASARFSITRTDAGKTNRGYGAFINVHANDHPASRFNGACANVSLESSAAFTDRIDRTLSQSNCLRATQYVFFEPAPNSIAPAQLQIMTTINANIVIPGEPSPGVSIVLVAIYNMQEASGPDITIDRMFSVQAVQRLSGAPVMMIPGKATLVRVFPKSVGENAKSVAGVRGLLSADEFPGVSLRPMNFATAVAGTPDVDQTSHSLNFLLPKEWTLRPRLTLNAVISLGDVTESNTENNKSTAPLVLAFPDANVTPPVLIDYWDVCITYSESKVRDPLPGVLDGAVVCPTDQSDRGEEPLRSILPVDEDRFSYQPIMPRIVWPNALESFEDVKSFQRFLTTMARVLTKARTAESVRRNELLQRSGPLPYYRLATWIPLLPRAEENSFEQFWSLFPAVGFDWCQTGLRPEFNLVGCSALSAHQFAYKFTIPLGAQGNGPFGPPGDTGFSSGSLSIVKSLQRSRIDKVDGWINAFDYERVAAELKKVPGTSSAKRLRAADETLESLLLSGSVRTDGSAASLDPAFRFSQSSADPGDPNGSWCIRVRRGTGTDVDSCFEAVVSPDPAESTFVAEVPWYPDVTRVSVIQRSRPATELASLVAGDAPSLSFSTPQRGDTWEGRQTITWSGSARGGETLTYMLLYSSDGGTTWLPLSVNLKESRFELDTSQIAGGSQVHFRVLASSGLNSTSVDVGPITIRQSPRLQLISRDLDFRNRTVGEVAIASLALRNSGSGPLTITPSLTAGSPFSVVSRTEQIVIPSGRQLELRIQYRPTATGQHLADLRLTGGGSTEVATLRGTAFDRVVPSIAGPASVDFGSVAVNSTKDVPVTIRNQGQVTLNIQSAVSSSTSYQPLTSSLDIPEGGQADVMVRVRPTAAGTVTGRLTLRSNDPTVPNFDIALTATGVAAGASGPSIGVSPPSLDFGSVVVNQSGSLTLTIANAGSAALNVASMGSTNGLFTLANSSSSFSIPPGTSQQVTVRFSPVTVGSQTGGLTISSNDPARPTITVPLSGTGAISGGTPALLQLDDGSFEHTFGFPDGGVTAYFVNRITPTRYPATLRGIQIFFPQNEVPAGSTITLLSAPHASATGGAVLSGVALQQSPARVNAINAMNDYDVAPITITSGDFIVGFSVTNPRDIYPIATDTSSPSRQRSYLGTDPNAFRLLDSIPGAMPGNFGIRARVE